MYISNFLNIEILIYSNYSINNFKRLFKNLNNSIKRL